MCLDYVTNNLKAKGSTIDFVYLDKDIVSIFSPVALVKGAKNEKNGKLLIDFILSKEGQEVLVANNLLSVRKDVKQKGESAETIAKRAMKVDLQALATGRGRKPDHVPGRSFRLRQDHPGALPVRVYQTRDRRHLCG